MSRLHTATVFLFLFAVINGSCAYIFPDYLINHDPLPETSTFSPDSAASPTKHNNSSVSLSGDNNSNRPETGTFGSEERNLCDSEGVYTKADSFYCDRYVTCSYGQTYPFECPDGYGFVPLKGCKLLHEMDCGSRIKLQPPKGSGLCPRLNGIHPDKRGCVHYIRCTNGTALAKTCTDQFIFDDLIKSCRDPTLEEYTSCFLQQQNHTTFNPSNNQQTSQNYDLLHDQAKPPITYKPSANEQPLSSSEPIINQQLPIPNPSSTPYQVVPTIYKPLINQQMKPTYNPHAYGNQQLPTPYNPPTSANLQSPMYNNPPPTTYDAQALYEMGTASTSSNGFACPPATFFAFGDHTRYEYPGNCHLFFICLRDGGVKLGGCQAPMAYHPKTQVCVAMQKVPSCSSNVYF